MALYWRRSLKINQDTSRRRARERQLHRGFLALKSEYPGQSPDDLGNLGYSRASSPWVTEPGSHWENGCKESFNGKLRQECLNGESFYSLNEAQPALEQWRCLSSTRRPPSVPGWRPLSPVTVSPQPTIV